MTVRLRRLQGCGCEVRLGRGENLTQYYRDVGREQSGRGILHSKMARIGPFLFMGSANWTISTRGNAEAVMLIKCEDELIHLLDTVAAEARMTTEVLTQEKLVQGERFRAEMTPKRTRSQSVRRATSEASSSNCPSPFTKLMS